MIAYADTSFLCAFYRQQDNSRQAVAHFQGLGEPLPVAAPLLFEFRQSLRFQVWLHSRKPGHGFSKAVCDQALADLQSDLDSGVLLLVSAEAASVHREAERISATHTMTGGHRTLDIVHIATALVLEAEEFISFDTNQRKLAAAEGLKVKP